MRRARLLLLVLLGCCACRPPVAGPSDELRLALPGSFGLLDGTSASGYGIWAEDLLYESLLTVGSDGGLRPRLAARWERAGPGRLRLWLRPGATFSDGAPADPNNVALALRNSELLAQPDGDSLLVTTTNRRLPPELVAALTAVVRSTAAGPVGTAAFAIASREGQRAVLRRRALGTPRTIATVVVTSYQSGREALAHVLRGEADLLPQVDGRSAELFEGIPQLQLVREQSPHTALIEFGKQLDRKTRRALAAALPLDEIGRVAFGGHCKPWPHRLAAAPLPPGPPLGILTHLEDPEFIRAALAIRRALGARGGEIRRVSLEELSRQLSLGKSELTVASAPTWPSGILALRLHSAGATNLLRYANAAVDAAFEAGEIERALAALDEDPPLVLLCSRDRLGVVSARVRSPRLGPWGMLESLPEWELLP